MSIFGFKGFDKNLKCREFQYEVGKEYETDQKPVRCTDSGFHFCGHPLEVFNYYPPHKSRYCNVEADGDIDRSGDDGKVAASKIKIGAEIGIKGIVEAAIKFVFEKTKSSPDTTATTGNRANAATTGNRANAATTGNRANAATTGYGANAATTGYGANAEVNGKESIAAALGIESKAKGALDCWIVLAERIRDKELNWHIKDVQSAKVDGEKIKADVFYRLKDGQFVEVQEDE